MRINRQGALNRTASAKRPAGKAGGGQSFSIEQASAGGAASAAQAPRPLGSVDALLALQELPDATTSTRRALRHAENVLDALEDVQMGLVVGVLPQAQLKRLLGLIRREQNQVPDPKLTEILKEVELRAQVELAKLGEFV